jgi:hypothetical protein
MSGNVRAVISRIQTTKQTKMKSETDTIISALRVLARDIQTDDGVVNACLGGAAGRLEELQRANQNTLADLAVAIAQRDEALKNQQPTTIVQQVTTRPEPSRLEIAAMIMQGFVASSTFGITIADRSLEYSDRLIAVAKEAK